MAYNISLFYNAIINSKKSHFLKIIRYAAINITTNLKEKDGKNRCRLVRSMN